LTCIPEAFASNLHPYIVNGHQDGFHESIEKKSQSRWEKEKGLECNSRTCISSEMMPSQGPREILEEGGIKEGVFVLII
jgi:hypothetical protein